jgi:outer membrane protein OmpA-like peptidoglycan-associated protein/Tfp pilus assembly protein PilF
MKACFPILFLLLASALTAQDYTTLDNVSPKLKKQYDKAIELVMTSQLESALIQLEDILKKDTSFIDAYIQKGNVLYDLGRTPESEAAFEKALAIDPDYQEVLWYQLGVTEWRQDKYTEAVGHFEHYLSMKPDNQRQIELARELYEKASFAANAVQNPVPFELRRLPEAINTSDQEYFPSFTADEQTLIFTRVVNRQEDFYLSEKDEKGEWSVSKPIETINTSLNEGAQTISADGRFLVFTACNRRGGFGGCDLYYSELIDGEWTPAKNIGAPINTRAWESQPSLSADGRTLFFASDQKGSSKKDIWVSYRYSNGQWSQPQNVSSVNSSGDDKGPFIHADGQTLYFMSDGHQGMGGFDLFYSRRQEDGSWGKPINMGVPINTKTDEGLLVVSLRGDHAYYASDRATAEGTTSSRGQVNYDIYEFELYPEARPQPVTYVQARVFHAETKAPLTAFTEFVNLSKNIVWTASETAPDGTFLAVLPVGADYALNVSKEGFLFHSEHFGLDSIRSLTEPFLLDIYLQPIPEGGATETSKPIVLKNVFFETGSAALRDESQTELNYLVRLLESNPQLNIQINGHTDNVGSEKDNATLSANRARAVYEYLIEKGISEDRLAFKGFGETVPVASNDTPAGRQENRRTEFEVIR